MQKNRFLTLLIVITLLGAFFRFYQLSDRLYFQLDEERDWHMFRRTAVHHRPPLIGSYLPPGLYLGPLWIWISALIGLAVNLNPFAYGTIASALGVAAIPLVYLVGNRLFKDKKIAIVASAIYSCSYLVTIYSRIWWPLTLSPLATLLVYYSLWKLSYKGLPLKSPGQSLKWSWVMFGALTLALHGEPPNLTTLILILTAIPLLKIPWKNRHFLGAGAMLFLSHLTLIPFDLKHNLVISRNFIALLRSLGRPALGRPPIGSILPQIIRGFTRVIYPSGQPDTVAQIGWCPEYFASRINAIPPILLAVSTIILLGFVIRVIHPGKPKTPGEKLATAHLIILTLSLLFFSLSSGTPIYEWFFYHLLPVFSLIWAVVMVKLLDRAKILFWGSLLAILIINTRTQLVAQNSHGLGHRAKAVEFALQNIPPEDSFSIDSLGKCFAWSGYRTLFIQKGRLPTQSYLDDLFGPWLYPNELSTQKADWKIVFVDHEPYPMEPETEEKYRQAKHSALTSARFAAVEVFVHKPPK